MTQTVLGEFTIIKGITTVQVIHALTNVIGENYCRDAVRGTDARVLHGSHLAADREVYMDWENPEGDHKPTFYYGVVEGQLFAFTNAADRILIQNQPLSMFPKSGHQIWGLEDFLNQVGILTGVAS